MSPSPTSPHPHRATIRKIPLAGYPPRVYTGVMETTSNQCCHSTSAQVSTASGTPTEKPAEQPAEAHTGACCSGEAPETQQIKYIT